MGWFDKIGQTVVGVVLAPVIVPTAIATVVYDEITKKKDEPEECLYCDKPVYEDDLCKKHYREQEREEEEERLIKNEKQKKKRKIDSEIKSFESASKRQIGSKYNVDISFNGKNVTVSDTNNGQIAHLKSHISELEAENEEIEKLIKDLQSEKDAV